VFLDQIHTSAGLAGEFEIRWDGRDAVDKFLISFLSALEDIVTSIRIKALHHSRDVRS
jgi:hypothetical protein